MSNQAKVLGVLAQRELARRRLLQFTKLTHPAYEAGWVHEDICERLEKFSADVAARKSPRLMLLMPPRHGKLLADDTPVYTMSGWRTHGTLRVGDRVLGSDAQWTRVCAISAPDIADVEITFCTGEKILAHENHEWQCVVLRAAKNPKGGDRFNGKYRELRTVETKEILEWCDAHGGSGAYPSLFKASGGRRFALPSVDYGLNPSIFREVRKRPRHLARVTGPRIESARRVAPHEAKVGRCIQVEAADGLYLVGRGMMVTHNSELASIRFPAWHLGHNPRHEIINVGYNLDLPIKFSRKVREVVRDAHYQAMFPDTRLDQDSQSAESWNTTKGGGFTAAGVGGGITGKGAHILIIDDPLKNMEEADSIDRRDLLDEWYQSTAYTRLAPGGGVLFIECLTGETPVLMADGSTKRMDAMHVGDEVATFDDGRLSVTRVSGWKRSGRDKVFKITTSSGKIVRANERHPFLVATDEGLKWTRTKNLSTASKIVTLKEIGVSGAGSRAQLRSVGNQPNVVDFATRIITEKNGPMGTEPLQSVASSSGNDTSSTATGYLSKNTTHSYQSKGETAQSAANRPGAIRPSTGKTGYASTTVTNQEEYEASCATTVTSPLDTPGPKQNFWQWLSTSDFTTETVVSVEPDGEEDVYDLRIEGTQNFIANGLVSHNTFWNDDDLAGRLQQRMAKADGADQFDIVKYPALSEHWEYRNEETRIITRSPTELPPEVVSEGGLKLLRPIDTCLHESRYPTDALKRIRSNMDSPRIWSALYQQNPVPDEGMYFRKEFFRYQRTMPAATGHQLVTAWDFAIGEKQQNDWTVGVTLLQDSNDTLYVMDVVRFKGDAMQIVENILDTAKKWGSGIAGDYRLGVEDGQIWRAIEPLLKKRMSERKEFWSYEPLKPLTDKLSRARPLQGRMQQGRVVFPDEASWLKDTQTEMLRFPAGAHDDVVDAMAWGVRLCISREPPKSEPVKQPESWKDKLSVESEGFGVGHMAA